MAGSTPPPSICPWRFLETIDSPPKSVPESPTQPSYQKKSFAQALSNSVVVPENPFPKTSIKGDAVSIKITEKESSKDKGNEGLVYVEPVTNHQAEPSGCKKDDVVEHHSRVPDSDPKEHEHEISYEQDFSKSIIEVDEGEGKNSEDTLVDDIQQHLSPNRGVLNTLKDTPNVIIIPTKASADLSENVQQDINIVKQLWGDEKEDGIEDNERGYTLVTHRKVKNLYDSTGTNRVVAVAV
ncbi:unnamed protein product [Trifolium pratense]|uniref:Uncharacterized protein n=1 Tax=Trifolium pratense TaxID=57577 RepID=A0ACB0J4K1_TRIPR|nr:unnamed protein product [Trifolium pratense]